MNNKTGRVYLVGAGPGDPTLITIKGRRYLEKAEVVIYDYLANKKLLDYAPADAQFIYAGKKGNEHHAHSQAEINEMLVEHAQAGKTVVRLKGGDPFIFGRGGEEIERLVQAGIPFEIVPGVTAATAAATYAGVPITHRGYTSSVAFLTGNEDPTKETTSIAWDKIATGIGTLIFYMGIRNLPMITKRLIAAGRSPETPAMVVRWASTPEQQSVEGTLATIAERAQAEEIRPPALVVIGEVVALRSQLNWFEKKPLFGKRVMVTRTRDQASELVACLEDMGAVCIEFPTIAIAPPDSWEILDQALTELDRYQWLLFTSINAVQCFFNHLFEKGLDARALKGLKIGVVGTTTARILENYGLKADLIPAEFTGDALAQSLIDQGVSGLRILLPRALKARENLGEMLATAGAALTIAPVYQNTRPAGQASRLRSYFDKKEIDCITFTSSSTVTNFLHMLGAPDEAAARRILADTTLASIGPITSKTIIKAGLAVQIQPEVYTIPALVDAIAAFYQR